MDRIHHFLHRHPLMPTEVEEEAMNDVVICSGCNDPDFPGPIYGCNDCKFYLHKSCSELPEKIQNFFHACPLFLTILPYSCNACFQNGFGFSYRCKICDFDMHVKCALRPTIKEEEEVVHHFTHWHPLKLIDQKQKEKVLCSICQKLCSNSSAYGCKDCNFFLHNSCMAKIPQRINHFFHPSCPLVLFSSKPYKCKGCDAEHNGSDLAFRCGKCNFQLDVKCALLPTVESDGADRVQHSCHRHPLAFREKMEFGNEIGCRACGENCLGVPCFVCENSSCNFFLHRSCAVEFPQEIKNHHFHPQHSLTLSALPPDSDRRTFLCRACGGVDEKFALVYRCATCDFNIHTCCVKPKPMSAPAPAPLLLKFRGHSHFLTFVDKSRGPFNCSVCWKPAQSCYFLCVVCEFVLHLYCHPSAPKTIKHKCHLHPLTLTSSPFEFELNSPEDEYNSDDEFYCDVCEEKRFKFEKVYHCEDCKFIAEIRCVISELLPSLIASQNSIKRVISIEEENSALEATIAKRDEEIAELRAKEKPLEMEVEKLEEMLRTIKKELEELETDNVLDIFRLNHNRENNYSTEASSS